jgi:hypothetical protein
MDSTDVIGFCLLLSAGIVVAIMVGITLGTIAGAVLLGIVFNINRKR